MPKHTYRVATEYGTFTRTTARDYHFVVASKGKPAATLAAANAASIQYENEAMVEYQKVIDSGVVPMYRNGLGKLVQSMVPLESYHKFIVDSAARHAKLTAIPDSHFEAESQVVHVWGWSSRRDLAEKEAAKARNFGYQDVRIFEVK